MASKNHASCALTFYTIKISEIGVNFHTGEDLQYRMDILDLEIMHPMRTHLTTRLLRVTMMQHMQDHALADEAVAGAAQRGMEHAAAAVAEAADVQEQQW